MRKNVILSTVDFSNSISDLLFVNFSISIFFFFLPSNNQHDFLLCNLELHGKQQLGS